MAKARRRFPLSGCASRGTRQTSTGVLGMVASAHPLATQAGVSMLQQGGNAVDAAVAAAATLNVVEPHMSGIAGIGYMLVHLPGDAGVQVLDFVGPSPAGAKADLYDADTIQYGVRCALVPGNLAGWLTALETHGTMDRTRVLAPAIRLAAGGFPLTAYNSQWIQSWEPHLRRFPTSMRVLMPRGRPPRPGEILMQPDLARTLRMIVEGGREVLYRGDLGKAIVEYVQARGGVLDMDDLARFQPEWRPPLTMEWRGFTLFCPAPPSSGFQCLLTLNLLYDLELEEYRRLSADALHLFIEAVKLAAADRARFGIGADPPIRALLSEPYAKHRRSLVHPGQAAPSGGERFVTRPPTGQVVAGDPRPFGGEETTYLCAADSSGMLVSLTQSLGGIFGGCEAASETGVFLNNFMWWFDLDPESPNAVGPGKRVDMCLSPFIVHREGRPVLAIGTPGGHGIAQTTAQALFRHLLLGMEVQEAIEAPRFKIEKGCEVLMEERISDAVWEDLEQRGHVLLGLGEWSWRVGGMQAIRIDPESGALFGGADPRRDGVATGL